MPPNTKITAIIDQAIAQNTFSGAQVLAGQGSKRLFFECYGAVSETKNAPQITPETLWDVASLTKPVVTAQLALLATKRGQLDLDAPLKKYLPDWQGAQSITLRHLLAHNSGLADWHPLYEKGIGESLTPKQAKENYLQQIASLPLAAKLGEQRLYSDLGFMLLGWCLENHFSQALDQLFQQEVAEPLNMKNSFFNPLARGQAPKNIAATEACPWRGKTLQGEVHDDNAFVLGGVAGHAGLFSTVTDLEKFVHWMWQHWQDPSVQSFVGKDVLPKLGWDTVSQPKSQAGQYFSDQTIGHLGFTGCSLWLDAQDQKYIILLNNSVHPHRSKEAIQAFRPKLHDLLVEELGLVSPPATP